MKKNFLLKIMNYWPPLLGAGIRIKRFSKDFREVDVEMKLTRLNQNYVGTHYGGSLYSMTDAFYMVMLIENLGRDYIVWDKAATIRFKKPGKGKVRCEFRLTEERLQEIIEQLKTKPKIEPIFMCHVLDEAGDVVAEVEKLLYVRKKERK